MYMNACMGRRLYVWEYMCLDVYLVFGGLTLTSDLFLRMTIHSSFTEGNISMSCV